MCMAVVPIGTSDHRPAAGSVRSSRQKACGGAGSCVQGVRGESRLLCVHVCVCACERCLRDFHTRERICTHVSASSRMCRSFYAQHGSLVDGPKLEKLESEAYECTMRLMAQGRRRTFAADGPPIRTDGPLHPAAVQIGVRHGCLTTKPPTKRRDEVLDER